MRFVARACIAFATLAFSAAAAKAQGELPTYTGGAPATVASDSSPGPLRRGPAAPASIGGAWISDKASTGPPLAMGAPGNMMPPPQGMMPPGGGMPGMPGGGMPGMPGGGMPGMPGGGMPGMPGGGMPGMPGGMPGQQAMYPQQGMPPQQGMYPQGPGQSQNFADQMAPPNSCRWEGDDPSCSDGGYHGPRRKGGLCALFDYNDMYTDSQAHRRIWVTPEYISWFVKGNPLPPLVTTSPPGTDQTVAAILGPTNDTQILFGNNRVDTSQRPGGRINFGYWLVDGEFLGIEGQYFALQAASTSYHANSTQIPGGILGRPFINADPSLLTPTEDAALLGFPNFTSNGVTRNLTGSVDVRTTSLVQGAGVMLRKLIWIDFTSQRRLDFIGGYRFFRYDDSVTINDATFDPGIGLGPITSTSQDLFSARNQFHGGDFGLKFQQYCCSRFSAELIGKVAFGVNAEQVYITGSNTPLLPPAPGANVGGLLTQLSNVGLYTRDVFAVLPEANANLRYDVTRNLRLTAGYTFIYLNRMQRSGDAIDRTVNPTQINGALQPDPANPYRPAFAFHDTSLWMQGFNAGIEYRW